MAILQTKAYGTDTRRYYREARSGARTAGNFTVTLGFEPLKVEVTNATSKISAVWHSDIPTPNSYQLLTAADNSRTLADAGISVTRDVITVTVATASLEVTNEVTIIEAWG